MSGLSIEQELARRDLLGLVEAIARAHHVTMGELLGRRRYAHIIRARHAAWVELRRMGWSFPAIAALWGVDHTSVIHAVRKAEPATEGVQ